MEKETWRSQVPGMLLVLAGWGVWSLDPILVFVIGPGVPRLLLATAGFLASGAVLIIPSAGILTRLGRIPRRHRILLLVLAVFFSGIPQLCYLSAIACMNPGMVSVILRTQIAFAILWAVMLMGERMNRICTAGVLMIVAANAFLMAQALLSGQGSASFKGWAFAFTGALLWSGGTISCKELLKSFTPLELTALRMLLAGSFLALVFLFAGSRAQIAAVTGKQWQLILLEGVITSGCGFVLYFAGLKRVPVYLASSLEPVAPLYTLLVAVFILRETVTRSDIMGTALLLTGSMVVVAGGFLKKKVMPVH